MRYETTKYRAQELWRRDFYVQKNIIVPKRYPAYKTGFRNFFHGGNKFLCAKWKINEM
jgi:hypothetical protein